MQLSYRQLGPVRVIAVQGRLDHTHAPGFESELLPQLQACDRTGMPVVLDFSGVEYISSVGLRVLMLAAKQVKAQQGRIAIAALSPIVAEIFQVSHFDMVLRVFADIDAASTALLQ